jgi:adenylylsulfate kinase
MSGVVVWLTGLPASGKSTLAAALRERLQALGRPVCVLDSDELRAAIRPELGYDDRARDDFYATLANLAAVLAGQGLVVLVAATAHLRRYRDAARARAPRLMEVYVSADSQECARRDPKGLYAAARAGTLSGLPGVDADYEPPERADVVARGGEDADALERVLARLLALR